MVEVLNAEIKTRIEMINRGEVPKGYKKTKVGIIPEDWEVKRLGDVCKMYSGGTPKTSNKNYYNGNIPWITSGDLNQGKIKSVSGKISKDGLRNSSAKMIKKGDLLLALYGATAGVSAISEIDAAINQAVLAILPANECNKYLYYILSLKKDFIISKYTQGGQPNLSASIIKALRISFPSLSEQQKIAQILSTWDEAIELKEKLIEEKKEQKKGLMQKLLTGEVRLPGFDGKWEEVRLGDIGKTFSGLTGKTSKDFGEGKPFITYKNIFTNSRVDIKDVNYVKILEDENQNTIKYGDIFFTISSETPDEVGMSSVLLDTVEELYLNSFCFGFRLNDFKTLVPKYARFLFRGDVFRRDIFKLAQGSTRFNLSKAEVLKLYIKLPTTDEQKAIAQILSTADKEINLLNQELEQLKLQKKGLMQLLLTGIIRMKC